MAVSFATGCAFAADSRNVSFINETGYAIKFLGFNGPDDGLDEWDNELEKTLNNQDTAYVEFDSTRTTRVASGTSRLTGPIATSRCSGRTSISAR
jgi:hypothetical protein